MAHAERALRLNPRLTAGLVSRVATAIAPQGGRSAPATLQQRSKIWPHAERRKQPEASYHADGSRPCHRRYKFFRGPHFGA